MPAIEEGQIFATLGDFKQALRDWAIEKNFTPHILDSDSHRVRAGCRSSPDCPFRIRANYSEKRGNARVTTCDNVHNCVSTSEQLVSQTIKRPEAGKLKFLVEAVPKIIDMEEPITTTIIIAAVKRRYGQDLPLRQAQKVKRALGCKPHGPCRECRRMGHSKKTCPTLYPNGIPPVFVGHELSQNNTADYDDSQMQIDSSGDNEPESQDPCTLCFQLGHTRNHCPSVAAASASTDNAGMTHKRAGLLSQQPNGHASDEVAIDPNLRHGAQRVGPGTAQTQPSERGLQSMDAQPEHIPVPPPEQPSRTPQETRVEAARLMQQAARLMQEAAKLNFEAARLTASAASH